MDNREMTVSVKTTLLLAATAMFVSCSDGVSIDDEEGSYSVKTIDDLSFQPLNPARGDASPQAGVLWGDIREDKASGMILKFANGFSSPPHIHNITYRGVVIEGGLHNDDPDAARMWMGPGSYWTQPAGESHITAAQPGAGAISFLEIFEGPYLVQPSSEAFETAERPVNVDPSNLVWLDSQELEWIDKTEIGPQISFLWGTPGGDNPYGSFLKLPAGYTSIISTRDDTKIVLIKGDLMHQNRLLIPGSFVSASGAVKHSVKCLSIDCQIYIRANSPFAVH